MHTSLNATQFIDCETTSVKEYARKKTQHLQDNKAKAIALYYAVRDEFYYDPYKIDLSIDGLKASTVLKQGYGWCVSKAILLTACCRAINIPAKLGFADVKNHLSTQKMREVMKTDIFYWHGYSSIFIDGNWLKATPAFNRQLCEKFSMQTLEFDGESDAIYHPYDLRGERHMEYLYQRGEFEDLPLQQMVVTYQQKYKNFSGDINIGNDFLSDIEKEN